MTLYTPKNGSHPNDNNISLGWQRRSISGASLGFSIRPQNVVGLDSRCRSVCYPGI